MALCCAGSGHGHVVVVADNHRNAFWMVLDNRFHRVGGLIRHSIRVLNFVIQKGAACIGDTGAIAV